MNRAAPADTKGMTPSVAEEFARTLTTYAVTNLTLYAPAPPGHRRCQWCGETYPVPPKRGKRFCTAACYRAAEAADRIATRPCPHVVTNEMQAALTAAREAVRDAEES